MQLKLRLAPTPKNFQRDSDSALLSTQAELIKLMSKLSKFEKQKADNKIKQCSRYEHLQRYIQVSQAYGFEVLGAN